MAEIELTPAPLPRTPVLYEEWLEHRHNYLSAYDKVYNAERHAVEQVEANSTNKEAEQNVVSARVAGHLLVELFSRRTILSEGPSRSLAKQLILSPRDSSDTDHDLVFRIGKWYREYFLRLFRTSTRQYSVPSSHPSRPSFDTLADMTEDCMMADSKDHGTPRRRALARDGFRCMLTGLFDVSSLNRNRELREQCHNLGYGSNPIQACHILNESAVVGVDPAGTNEKSAVANKTDYAATAIAILRDFELEDLAQEFLAEDGVHGLGNLLSLEPGSHSKFDTLDLWLESTDEPNRYNVCASDSLHLRNFHGHLHADGDRLSVTFSQGHKDLQLPNPQLLALHAACARVAHMSGTAKAFDELERDIEDGTVLAFDGSSARLLDHLMTPFAAIPGVA